MIFWGPPGVGKTTLALLISNRLQWPFFKLSAINSGVKEVRDVIEKARQVPTSCILFIDKSTGSAKTSRSRCWEQLKPALSH